MKAELKLLSALQKVFADQAPSEFSEEAPLSGMKNEVLSFQAAFSCDCPESPARRDDIRIAIVSALPTRVRRVRQVPVELACFPEADENYLRRTPGLYPDLLQDMGPMRMRLFHHRWETVWIDIEPNADTQPGIYPVEVQLMNAQGELLQSRVKNVEIIAAELPPQALQYTRWFHCDCLAQEYHVPVFSEEHWRIIENFVRAAVRRGMNMMLTPIHTPPLDTRVGTERLTTQLVDVNLNNGVYSFGFEKLDRWVKLCQKCGVQYYEMAHLFTQWGAAFTPKILAQVDGEMRRIFGWDVAAQSDEYRAFINAYLPALTAKLRELGIADRCVFHISDEPRTIHMDNYLAAKALVKPHLEGFTLIDALSEYAFYASGAVEKPVPANNHIEPFLEGKVPGLWTYYCVSQYFEVSNQFIAMPSARNRILGVQLYKYDIEGFLHWGYNFYNAQYSDYPIDPYFTTDGDGFAPGGDPFQVYPGPEGRPEESIRIMVTAQAIYDLRALRMLESIKGRDYVLAMIDEGLETPITFSSYPKGDAYLLNLRARVNREIAASLAK